MSTALNAVAMDYHGLEDWKMYWDQITESLEGFAKDFGLYSEAEGTSKISKQGSINNYIWKDDLGSNWKNTMIRGNIGFGKVC